MIQAIGWLAALVLLMTIGWQVFKQWHEHTSRGVSVWLFIGQITANALFLVYAALTGDVVFMTANGLLLLTSLLGLGIKLHHSRRNSRLGRLEPCHPPGLPLNRLHGQDLEECGDWRRRGG